MMNSGKLVARNFDEDLEHEDKENTAKQPSREKQYSLHTNKTNMQNDPHHHSLLGQRNKILSDQINKTADNIKNLKKKVFTKLDPIELTQSKKLNKISNIELQLQKKAPANIVLNKLPETLSQQDDFIVYQNGEILSEKSHQQFHEQIQLIKQIQNNKESSKPKINASRAQEETTTILVERKAIQKQKLPRFTAVQPESTLEDTTTVIIPVASVFEECSHVMKHIKQNCTLSHSFNRHQSCSFSEPVTFNLPTKHEERLISQKKSRFLYSQFEVSLIKNGERHLLGTLKSNLTGSLYNFYPADSEAIYFSILFKNQHLSCRSSQVYINVGLESSQGHHVVPYLKMESLEGLYRLNMEGSGSNENIGKIHRLSSKEPEWSEKLQSYYLKFGGKSVFPSVKNTILVDEKGQEIMKFYKNSYLTYNVTFNNPVSWILAYCYALASVDFKLFTQ